ncbi:hypothetical protein L615_000600000830 [Nocardioides sp. J9]|uniref:hypothetical protein n=1 Tax=Nocardioides sp. J9 TaxID=935844 RepID=UPI0011A893D2|nr:hypothetical protein [Nocardioides sp. J9]TWG93970.1 hypothetical protein L615_000600000830 [Nocardioides sp. J9]
MKQIVVGLIAAAMVTFGLGAGAAEAYVPDVKVVQVKAKSTIKKNAKPSIRVKAKSGNARPVGWGQVRCVSLNGKKVFKASGHVKNGVVPAPKIARKGVYNCSVKFTGKGKFVTRSFNHRAVVR